MPKLTKRIVDATEIKPAEYFVWDSEIPGFGLRVLPTGPSLSQTKYSAGLISVASTMRLVSLESLGNALWRVATQEAPGGAIYFGLSH